MLTLPSLIDRLEPYVKSAIDAELPIGTRWVAHKIARWKIEKTLHALIAAHGRDVAVVVDVLDYGTWTYHEFRETISVA